MVTGCGQRGLSVSKTATEVGSGLNGKHTKLRELCAYPNATTIVPGHRKRLIRCRFRFRFVRRCCRCPVVPC